MSITKPIVHLRVYKPGPQGSAQISYDKEGNIQNENILVKLTHNTLEWSNYLKHLSISGFIRVDVEKIIDGSKELIGLVEKEIEEFSGIKKEELSTKDAEIAELKKQLEAMKNKDLPQSPGPIPTPPADNAPPAKEAEEGKEEITALRAEYAKLKGNGAFNGWNVEQLKEKIAALKSA